MLVIHPLRKNEKTLIWALIAVCVAAGLDKGLGLVLGGFVPNPVGRVVEYYPTSTELAIVAGVYALGLLLLTILYKVVVGVRAQTAVEVEH